MRLRVVLARIAWALLAVALTLVLLAGTGLVLAARASLPTVDGTARLPGLSAGVTVLRDSWGVPQIYADSAEDLFRAQGYVHAQDRFWEMDFRRHITAGRLSELFGASQVDTDAAIRTMGWRRAAEAEYPLLDPRSRAYLRAYADGVNAWLGEHSGLAASLEYGALKLTAPDYRIERWDPVDSIAWLKAMAWDLRGNVGEETQRALMLADGMPRARIEELYPRYPYARNAPILATGAVANLAFDPGRTAKAPTIGTPAGAPAPATPGQGGGAAVPALDAVTRVMATVPTGLGPSGSGIGSNSWVVAGSRTATGKPILANDPHLGPAMPSVWTQLGLHCRSRSAACPFDVTGFTFSGMPGVIIGHNDRIAWGFTNLGADVADLYLERVTGDTYEVAGQARPLTVRTETIKVAGGENRTITVRSTGHGPLLSDVDTEFAEIGAAPPVDSAGNPSDSARTDARYAVALRWTALDPGRTMDAVFALNAARGWDDFRAAAKLFTVPAQNMVYADVDGTIGYQTPGDIPIRGKGDGRWPAPGWDPAYDWKAAIPFEALPWVKNPAEGLVVTANQAVVDGSYPYSLTTDWGYGYRSQRIRDRLAQAGTALTVDDMTAIQLDSRSGIATDLAPALTRLTLTGPAAKAQEALAAWDLTQPVDSAGAALFNATWRHLLADTFNDDLPAAARSSADGGERWFTIVGGLLDQPDSPWWDDRGTAATETRDDILARAVREATTELTEAQGSDPSGWRWGRMHTLTVANQSLGLSGIPPLEWLLNRGPYAVGGGAGLVAATGWSAPNGYAVNWVPSMRLVVDLGDLDASRWINLTGASGHAFDRHYADQTPLWAAGKTVAMPFSPAAVRSTARHSLALRP